MHPLQAPTHLELSERKVIFARLAYFDTNGPQTFLFGRQGALTALDTITDTLRHYTERALKSSNTEPLDTSVRGVSRDVALALTPLLTDPQYGQHISLSLTAYEQAVHQLSCASCVPSGRICDGSFRDNTTVAEGGLCIQSILTLAAVAQTAAFTYYNTYADLFSNIKPPTLLFQTKNYLDIPHDVPIPYFVGGRTDYYDDGVDTASIVTLFLTVTKFDWPTYMAILYILMHEYICHVYQGTLSTISRISSEPDESFCEGWMDWVAYKLTDALLRGEGLVSSLLPKVRFPSDVLKASTIFHELRADFDNHTPSEYAIARAEGVTAGKKTFSLIKLLTKKRTSVLFNKNPEAMFFKLSFNLNLLQRSYREWLKFVGAIEQFLPLAYDDPHAVKTPLHYGPFFSILEEYFADNEIGSFFSKTVNLL